MKTANLLLSVILLGTASLRLHSQSKPAENTGALLLQVKAANDALIGRQAATLEILKAMAVDSNQLRIVSKRG